MEFLRMLICLCGIHKVERTTKHRFCIHCQKFWRPVEIEFWG